MPESALSKSHKQTADIYAVLGNLRIKKSTDYV